MKQAYTKSYETPISKEFNEKEIKEETQSYLKALEEAYRKTKQSDSIKFKE